MKSAKHPPLTLSILLALGLSLWLMPTTAWTAEKEDDDELEYRLLDDGTADLGTYKIKIFDSILRKTLHINFELLGSVNFDDKKKFEEYMKGHYRHLRDLVNTSVRTCTPEELTDPTHQILSRKITSRVNRVFGWRFLNSIEPINYRLVQWSVDEGMVPIPLKPIPQKPTK